MKKLTGKDRLKKFAFGDVVDDTDVDDTGDDDKTPPSNKPTKIPLPDYKNADSRLNYASAFRDKYKLPSGLGDTPLRVNEKPQYGSDTAKNLATKYAKSLNLDPALLYASAMHEGMSGVFPYKEKGAKDTDPEIVQTTKDKDYPVSGLWAFGLDSFPDEVDNLKKKGYLPKDFDSKWKMGADAGNNDYKPTDENSPIFKDTDSAMQASAAMLRRHYDSIDDYAKKKNITLSSKARDFFSLADFNTGKGSQMLDDYNNNGYLKDDSFLKNRPTSGKGLTSDSWKKVYENNIMPRLRAAEGLKSEGLFAMGGIVKQKKYADGGIAGGGTTFGGGLASMIPGIANTVIGLIDNNPNQYSREPTVNVDTMRQMMTPYKPNGKYAMGGQIDDETMSQLQDMADQYGMSVEDLLDQLHNTDSGGEQDGQDQDTDEDDSEDMVGSDNSDQFAMGGIHINPKNKGKFNALKKKTGKSTEQLTHSSNPLTKKRAIFAQNAKKWKHAMGGVATPIEAEGGEVVQTPNGDLGKIKGPSHEDGGVDMKVPDGTKIYSDRLAIDGKTMQERKLTRERTLTRLNKLMSKNPQDKLLQGTYNRTMDRIQKEESSDMNLQKVMNKEYNAVDHFAYGGKVKKYAYGDDVDPTEDPGNPLGLNLIDATDPNASNWMDTNGANPATGNPQFPVGQTAGSGSKGFMGKFSAGDLTGIGGNLFNAIAPILNTKKAAATTAPNVNRYLGFGHDALDENTHAQSALQNTKSEELSDIDTQINTSKNTNRNSSGNVNTLRALDAVTDMQGSKAKQGANDSFSRQMAGLFSQRGQLDNQRDTMVDKGASMRDIEDKADHDDYYSNMGQNLTNFGNNIQGIGRSLNVNKSNKVNANLISQLSQFGLGLDDDGSLYSKKS